MVTVTPLQRASYISPLRRASLRSRATSPVYGGGGLRCERCEQRRTKGGHCTSNIARWTICRVAVFESFVAVLSTLRSHFSASLPFPRRARNVRLHRSGYLCRLARVCSFSLWIEDHEPDTSRRCRRAGEGKCRQRRQNNSCHSRPSERACAQAAKR